MTNPVVYLNEGAAQGRRVDDADVFLGIPYAAPPVGELRFRPPWPALPWTSVRDAGAFGPIAHQPWTPLEELQGTAAHRQSEDCLTLNIWTPRADDQRRPVLVWLHGGAFVTGSGAAPSWDGTSFAVAQECVVVSINYRLNVFGYLHLADVSDEVTGTESGAGNCGLLDQIAALEWVRDQIAAFGGDPEKVTIFGESAGAMSVGVLLGTPRANRLFHQAIVQSGAASHVLSRGRASEVTTQLFADLNLPRSARGVAALREMPAEDVLAAGFAAVARLAGQPENLEMLFAPVVDGDVLPVTPLTAIASGSARDVALLGGTNLDEMEVMRLIDPSFCDFGADELARRFRSVFGEDAERAALFYGNLAAGTARNPWTAVDSDRAFLLPWEELLRAQGAGGGRSWSYLFTWSSTAQSGVLGSFHTLEIPFVFNTLDKAWGPRMSGDIQPKTRELADRMHASWAQFARTGNPNIPELPFWPTWSEKNPHTMVFDVTCTTRTDPQRERRDQHRKAPSLEGSGNR